MTDRTHSAISAFTVRRPVQNVGARAAQLGDHFPLFSVTKPLVAMTAMRAVERGLLALINPLSAAVPGFGANRVDAVELRHLLAGDAYGHSGWAGCEFWVYPEQGVSFTLLTNVINPAGLGVNIDRLHNAIVAGTPLA